MPAEVNLGAIEGFRLVAADPAQLAAFYRAVGFTIGQARRIPVAEMRRLGLSGTGERIPMSLGPSQIDLEGFDPPGRSYPWRATACDLIFQHLALVTDDARTAWARAREAGAVLISAEGPVRLPASAGGVTAVKFRDPEGHPLEFLQFPAVADSGWTGAGVLGIDHSAISVGDLAASRSFYEARGLNSGAASLNRGSTQAALDGLAGVKVEVLAMNPAERPPHLELLAYRAPRGHPLPQLAANDIAAARVLWRSNEAGLVRDPDGHLHELEVSAEELRR